MPVEIIRIRQSLFYLAKLMAYFWTQQSHEWLHIVPNVPGELYCF